MTEMKTIKITADIHRRLTGYKYRLQAQRGEACTFGDAIDEALKATATLKEKM